MSDHDHIIKLDTDGRGYNLYYDHSQQTFIACLGDYIKMIEFEMLDEFVFNFVVDRDNNNKVFLYIDDTFCDFELDDFKLEMVSDTIEDLYEEVLDSYDIDIYIKTMVKKYYDKLYSENKEILSRLELESKVIKDVIFKLEHCWNSLKTKE